MQYLMIENPGVAAKEAFTLLGATTKGSSSRFTIGQFGSGTKYAIATLLRVGLHPIVFCGHTCMEFNTKRIYMEEGGERHPIDQVVCKLSGKDDGKQVSRTEDLGYSLGMGRIDWTAVEFAIREFVSNSIDSAISEGERNYLDNYKKRLGVDFLDVDRRRELIDVYSVTATDYANVDVKLVEEKSVRAKAGMTRVFIPLKEPNAEIVEGFYKNLGKWFLHFSEPEKLSCTVLPKADRNLVEGHRNAVIYRRGVRVREFGGSTLPSLFDYNLNDLEVDESRKINDSTALDSAGTAFVGSDVNSLKQFFKALVLEEKCWEGTFGF